MFRQGAGNLNGDLGRKRGSRLLTSPICTWVRIPQRDKSLWIPRAKPHEILDSLDSTLIIARRHGGVATLERCNGGQPSQHKSVIALAGG